MNRYTTAKPLSTYGTYRVDATFILELTNGRYVPYTCIGTYKPLEKVPEVSVVLISDILGVVRNLEEFTEEQQEEISLILMRHALDQDINFSIKEIL